MPMYDFGDGYKSGNAGALLTDLMDPRHLPYLLTVSGQWATFASENMAKAPKGR